MDTQPLPQTDPFAEIPTTPPVSDAAGQPEIVQKSVQQPQPVAAVHEIDLFAPPTALPQPLQPDRAEYWPQPALSVSEKESLFGRERLTRTHKIVISVVTVVVIGVVVGVGIWLYFSTIQPQTAPAAATTTTTNTQQKQTNTNQNTNTSGTPSTLDTDNDGLTDEAELRLGTNPNNRDTDGDSYTDGDEVQHGYSPLK